MLRALFIGTMLAAVASVCIAQEEFSQPDLVSEVQLALLDYGYNPGPVDGQFGRSTSQAISRFQSDTAQESIGEISVQLLQSLGLVAYNGHDEAEIFVISDRTAGELHTQMEAMNRVEVIEFVNELRRLDQRSIDLQFAPAKAVVFVFHVVLEPGTKVRTYASNILGGVRNSWHEWYTYKMNPERPTAPLVIINEFETANPMYLYHEAHIGDELVAVRYTRAK